MYVKPRYIYNKGIIIALKFQNYKMKPLLILLLSLTLMSFSGWENDLETAQLKAGEDNKYILLNFSGSDWCGNCIKMRKEIFESEPFQIFAENNLVLLNADFPRLSKNQLTKDQQKKNDLLAEKYNSRGSFPFTLLLKSDGSIVKVWDGYQHTTPEEFIAQISTLINNGN